MQLKIKLSILLWYVVAIQLSPSVIGGVPPRSSFHFIYENTYENDQLGDYTLSDFNQDWFSPAWNHRREQCDIIQDTNPRYSKYMRGYFPKGIFSVENSGFGWQSPLQEQVTEMYFSYDIRFKPGFQWVLGGKMPGMIGGELHTSPNGGLAIGDGFSTRPMWKQDGRIVMYIYHHDMTGEYGDSYNWNYVNTAFYFQTGQWYNITLRVVLNSVNTATNKGYNNGILEGWVDGVLRFQKTNFRFRNLNSIDFDYLYVTAFFGGDTQDWAATRDEWMDTDNYVSFTYNSNVPDVPHGIEPSSGSKKLIHPYLNIDDTQWESSLQIDAVETNQITLSWGVYPLPTEYFLERKLGNSDNFTQIARLSENTTNYTDAGLAAATEYVYRIKAGTSVSNELIIVTSANQSAPGAPSLLKQESVTKTSVTLLWQDNSSKELGFIIERSDAPNLGFQLIDSLPQDQINYADKGLEMNFTYSYRVRAFNQYGNSIFSNVCTISTIPSDPPTPPNPPNPPTELESPSLLGIEELTENSVMLSWLDNSISESNFILEKSTTDTNSFSVFDTLGADITLYSDYNLDPETNYYYRLKAINALYQSAYSNSIKVQTNQPISPYAPSSLNIHETTGTSVTLSWKDNSTNEKSFLITRKSLDIPVTIETFTIPASDTLFTDKNLQENTIYEYHISAIINSNNLDCNQNAIASTLSIAEGNRVKDKLIVYYNFKDFGDFTVKDLSGFEEPLNLSIVDTQSVVWKKNDQLQILSKTILQSKRNTRKIIASIQKSNEITVECWVKPSVSISSSEMRIVSIGESDSDLGFSLSQNNFNAGESNSFFHTIRVNTESTGQSGNPKLASNQNLSHINLQHLVYVRDSLGYEAFYLDGKKINDAYRPDNFSTWKENYYLRLANEQEGNMPWLGTYYLLAIYSKALTSDEVTTNYLSGPSDDIVYNENQYSINVIPNPVNENSILLVTPVNYSDITASAFVRIIDSYGRVIFEEELFNPGEESEINLNAKMYSKGIYFVQVYSGAKSTSYKFIVN